MTKKEISKTIINSIIKSLKDPKDLWERDKNFQNMWNEEMKIFLYSSNNNDDPKWRLRRKNDDSYTTPLLGTLMQDIRIRKISYDTSGYTRTDLEAIDMPLELSFFDKRKLSLAVKKRLELFEKEKERMIEESELEHLNDFLNSNKKLKRNIVVDDILNED